MSALQVAEAREIVPAPLSETAAVLSMIERVAKDPSVDIDRVERMMAMHRELRKEEAERAFNAAMVAVQAKLPQVKRDARNSQTNSSYAKLETISAAVDPIIAEHGLSLSFGTDTSPLADHYRIVCDVRHGPYKERYWADIPVDSAGMKGVKNKTDTHAFGSTMSYGRRYLKLMIFDISLTNEDNDGNRYRAPEQPHAAQTAPTSPARPVNPDTEPGLTDEQVMSLRDLLQNYDFTERDFCKGVKVGALADIAGSKFNDAVALIRQTGERNGR